MILHQHILELLEQNSNAEIATQQKAYLRGQFNFFGVKKKVLDELIKPLKPSIRRLSNEEKMELIELLWDHPCREPKYIAMDILKSNKRLLKPYHLDWVKSMILTDSWWDTVDLIATHFVGQIMKSYPEMVPALEEWSASDNLWLNRTTIIYQLFYKSDTDVSQLSRMILAHADSSAFFHQKAIGWALRQYSRTDPEWVTGFVNLHELKPLSKREAMRLIR